MNKWDHRHQSSQSPGEPCWVLEHNRHLLPDSGRSLDIACGLGANAILLAEQGLQSHAWDYSDVALQKLLSFAVQTQCVVTTELRDVERNPPTADSFNVIVVSHFLYRPLFPFLVDALLPGGLMFYQTWHQHKRAGKGPSNPDYLLETGELLQRFSALQTLFYREDGVTGQPQSGLRDISYYVGRKPD